MKQFAASLIVIAFAVGCTGRSPQSEWVHPGADGKLAYKTTERGDRIMDFSYAGYVGGGVAIPDVPVKVTVKPSGAGDDTAAIQRAIDQVAAMPAEGGFRGAVLLAPGTFVADKTLVISKPGVVLRGSGSGAGGTTLRMTGSKHVAVVIGAGRGERTGPRVGSGGTTVTDAYVPEGTRSFDVKDAVGLAVGDVIAIRRPTTEAWVHFMGMDTLKRDGRPQTWIATSRSEVMERKITRIEGNRVTVDVPVADSFDAKYVDPLGVSVVKVAGEPAGRVTQAGVEGLRISCPAIESAYGEHPYAAVRVGGDDCWVRDVWCDETMNSIVMAGRRITIQRVAVTHTYPNLGASKPADFSIEGSQILIDRCSSDGGNTYWVWTGSLQPGPNVVLNSVFRGHGSRIQPHQRWSTALLVDNCAAPDGGIDFMNRGVAGSGHGWTMGWAVAWNCVASFYTIQRPPGTENWAIGCIGRRERIPRLFDSAPILPEGTFDSYGKPVAPQSLYLAQLAERLGPGALKNIGYQANAAAEFPGRKTPPLPPQAREDDPELGPDLALHRPINGSPGRGETREFAPEKAIDANPKTYWSPRDGGKQPTLEIDMEGPVKLDALALEEAGGSHVQEYQVEAQVNSDWTVLAKGTTIGARKVDRFPKVTAWKIRLTVLRSDGPPAIRKFGLYLDPKAKG